MSSTLRSTLDEAAAMLAAAGIATPRPDALALMAHVRSCDVSDIIKAEIMGQEVDAGERAAFVDLVEARAGRVPLQHLTGRAAFRGLLLRVGPGVFVPRPETETTAQYAIDAARAAGPGAIAVDLCSGSGALALALASEVPGLSVYAVELSDLAHGWARANIDDSRLDVSLVCADATTALPELDGRVDVVVANPPYIPMGSVPVDAEVAEHDPSLALYGGPGDGLGIPVAVASRAAELLRPGGVLVMEHADTQGESLPAALAATASWDDIADHADLTGRPRVTTARRRPA